MATLGRNDLKNRTFSIFQTASSQGFPVNLPWLKYISMVKTSNENAGQKRQCKPAFKEVGRTRRREHFYISSVNKFTISLTH